MPDVDPLAAARTFLAEDPDPVTRAELAALLEAADGGDETARAEIADRFSGPLEFGTAGLRGRVGAGIARMNRLVVMKATWGLGAHLLASAAEGGPDPRVRGVVVGFDGRTSSRRFAEDVAAVLAGLGLPVEVAAEVAAGQDAEMARCILGLYRSAAPPAMRDLGARLVDAKLPPGLVIIPAEDTYPGTPEMAAEVAAHLGAGTKTLDGLDHWWMFEGAAAVADALVDHWKPKETL